MKACFCPSHVLCIRLMRGFKVRIWWSYNLFPCITCLLFYSLLFIPSFLSLRLDAVSNVHNDIQEADKNKIIAWFTSDKEMSDENH
jgi:hypothetical protein